MVKLKDFQGWEIFVHEHNGTFEAKKGKHETLEAETYTDLELLIKRQNATDRHFKPIDVFRVSDLKKGRITSWVADKNTDVYFSSYAYKTDTKMSRSPERLVPWGIHDDEQVRFVVANPANLAIVEQIQQVEDQIDALQAKVKQLKGTFTEPVTVEMIENQSEQDTDRGVS